MDYESDETYGDLESLQDEYQIVFRDYNSSCADVIDNESLIYGVSYTHMVNTGAQKIVDSLVISFRKLAKNIGFLGGFCMLVSTIIGSGIFISPSLVMVDVSDVSLILILWLFVGLIVLIGAMCYCELGTTISSAGGCYIYFLSIYGPIPAFICSWTLVLLVYPIGIATIALTLGNYAIKPFDEFLEPNPWYAKAVAAGVIVLISITNCASLKAASHLQTLFTSAQLISVFFLIGLGIWQVSIGKTDNLKSIFQAKRFEMDSAEQLGAAFFACMWAYNGWQLIANITEEMINVERNLVLIVLTSIPFVVACYLAVNVALLTVLTPLQIGQSKAVAVDFVQLLLGKKVSWIIPVFAVASCYGSTNACVFSCPRVTLSAGREGHMPQILGMIHKTRNTPIPAILLISILSILALAPNASNLTVLINLAGFASWFLFLFTIVGIIVLRFKKPNLYRPFKVWIIAPILMTILSVILIVVPVMKRPLISIIALGFMLLGLPVYFLLIYFEDRHPVWFQSLIKKSTKFLKRNLNLAPCMK